jgi:predicted nucleic acid-binding protein
METYSIIDAQAIFSDFDAWTVRTARRVPILPGDMKAAKSIGAAPDALHIAVAQRNGAALVTFDEKMAACAKAMERWRPCDF